MAIEAKIKAVFQDQLRADGNFYHYPNSPKLSDSELLAISIQAESEGINSENHLFTVLKGRLPGFLDGRISRPRFNIRKRKLNLFMEDFFLKAHGLILPSSTHFVVDSTPLPVCKLARIPSLKNCKDNPDIPPKMGKCIAKKEDYFGFKIHLISTQDSVPYAFSITSANVHDLTAFQEMTQVVDLKKGEVLADKGYVSNPFQLHLFEKKEVRIKAKPRLNMKTPINWTPKDGAIRRRIETLFSQLHDQFALVQNFAKTFNGLCTRITHKLAAVLICQVFNNENDRPINAIKSSPFS